MTQSHKKNQLFSCNSTHRENIRRPRIIEMTLTLSLKREKLMTFDETQIFRKLAGYDRITGHFSRYEFLKLVGYKQVFPPLQQLITHKN